MNIQEFNKLFTTDFNIDNIACTYRSWDRDTKYNYIETPRRCYGLMLLTDYAARFQLPDGSTFQQNPGDLMLLPQGARYTVNFLVPEGKKTHPVVINFRLRDINGKEVQLDHNVFRLCSDDGTLLPLFTATMQLYKDGITANLKAKVYEIFGKLFPIHETDECCIHYINQHYTFKFSIPELAKRCALSESSYRKQFKQLTGMSPVEYINHLKIEKACQMLLTDDMRPQDISNFLNFYNLPYFYKVFKDCTGMTPYEYLKEKTDPPVAIKNT